MLLNSTLDILEISENKRDFYYFFTNFWVRPWFLPPHSRMAKQSVLPSFFLFSFLFPPSLPSFFFRKSPCERCKESILQQAHPVSRLSGDPGGSLWPLGPQELFASITRRPSVWLCGFALCYLLPFITDRLGSESSRRGLNDAQRADWTPCPTNWPVVLRER